MSGFDDFYHPQYYSLPASNRDHDDPQNVQDSGGDPVVTSSLMGYSQSGAYDFGHYQNVYDQSQAPSVFRDGTPTTSTSINTGHPTYENQLQAQNQQSSHHVDYPVQGSNLEGRLSNVNISYGPWSGAENPMLINPHAGSAFPYDFANTYSMPPQFTSQNMGLNPQSTYSTLQTQTPAQNTYWGMDGYRASQQDESVSQGQCLNHQVYPQTYSPRRPLQSRAIQPKKQSFQDSLPSKVKTESHIETSPYTNIYSTSGFDILGVLARVISRPAPKINIGAVDLSCAFVLCDMTQDDHPIVYMSEAFGRLTGYSEDEIVGRNCRFLQSPDGKVEPGVQRKFADSNTVYRMRTTIEERNEIQVSVINYRKGGQPFMNLVTMIPIRWDTNEYQFYVGFQVDLVEKPDAVTKKNPNGTYMINYQRSQLPNYVVPQPDICQSHPDMVVQFDHDQVSAILRSINASRPEYKHYLDQIIAENADDVIHVLSYDGLFLYLSPSCQKILEYESVELVNKTLSSVCHPSDIGTVTRDLRTSTTTAPVSVVYRIRKKHSGYAWFESHGAWHVEQGRGRTFLVLTGRERAVYHLGQIARLGSEPLGETDIWAKISASGIILYISTKARPVLGRTQDDLVGTSFKDFLGAESHSEVQQALQSSRNGQRAMFNHQVRHKKGHMVQAQTVLFPGDTKEGTKPSFLVAQIRFPKSSQSSSEEPMPTETTTSIPARDQTKPSTDQQQTLINSSSANHLPPDNRNVPSIGQITIFPELIPTRGSSWQFELRELEKRNRGLSDEIQRLLTRRKKRKRKQTSMPVDKSCVMCYTKNTPEWRRGPSGNRDLCNSCGLRWAKQVRSAAQIERSGSG